MGQTLPSYTTESNNIAHRALCRQMFKMGSKQVEKQDSCNIVLRGKSIRFAGIPGNHKEWSDEELAHARFFLISFTSTVNNLKAKDPLNLSALKSCIVEIQETFSWYWRYNLKLLEGYVFNGKERSVMAVVNNRMLQLQIFCVHTKSYRVLSTKDLFILYSSKSLSNTTAKMIEYKARVHQYQFDRHAPYGALPSLSSSV